MKKFLISLALFLSFSPVYAGLKDLPFEGKDAELEESFETEKMGKDLDSDDFGAKSLQSGLLKITEQLTKVMGLFVLAWILYAGFQLVSSSSEDDAKNHKRQVTWGIIALMMTFLVEPIVTKVFYGGVGSEAAGLFENEKTASEAAKVGITEITGVISYLEMFIALIALVMLVFSALKVFFAQDSDDALENQKKTVIWAGVGLILIALSETLVYFGIYDPNSGKVGGDSSVLISEASGLMNYFMGFLAAIVVALLVYGGFQILTSDGDGDKLEKGKSMLKHVFIGSIVIVISYSLISLIISGTS